MFRFFENLKNIDMKKTNADIRIEINVECPHCEEYINLLELDEMVEEGYIYVRCFPDGEQWGCNGLNETIECPECKKDFIIEDVQY